FLGADYLAKAQIIHGVHGNHYLHIADGKLHDIVFLPFAEHFPLLDGHNHARTMHGVHNVISHVIQSNTSFEKHWLLTINLPLWANKVKRGRNSCGIRRPWPNLTIDFHKTYN